MATLLAAVVACHAGAPDTDCDGVADRVDRCGFTPRRLAVDAEGCSAAARALEKGIRAVATLDESGFRVGDAWVLRTALAKAGGPTAEALTPFVGRLVERLKGDPMAPLIDSGVPRAPLPPSAGLRGPKLFDYIRAPAGDPPERAAAFVAEFVKSEEAGYVLTHQFLTLRWARERGLELPAAIRGRGAGLLVRISKEQAGDEEFSDLFAERAALLLTFGNPERNEADRWVTILVASQSEAGIWSYGKPTMFTFGRFAARATQPSQHTTPLALLALQSYLRRY